MAFTYDQTQVTKREYDIYIVKTGVASLAIGTNIETTAVLIGVLAEQPKITIDKGEDVPLNTGAKVVISENITFEGVLYEVTSLNYAELRKLIGETATIWMADGTPTVSGSELVVNSTVGSQLIKITNMALYSGLEILGNGQNKINLSAELEAGVSDANVTITETLT